MVAVSSRRRHTRCSRDWSSDVCSSDLVACGLKRGFTFYFHEQGQAWRPRSDRANELLVAASPHDQIADTHWYRPDFDHLLVQLAQAEGRSEERRVGKE